MLRATGTEIPYVGPGVPHEFDRVFVIEEHDRIGSSSCHPALVEQLPGVQQTLAIALQPGLVPGQVDERLLQDLARVGSCRLLASHASLGK